MSYETLGSVEIVDDVPKKFKGDPDKVSRIGFPLVRDGRLIVDRVDYYSYTSKGGDWASWQKSDNETVNEQSEQAGAELKTRWITPVVVYETNDAGAVKQNPNWYVAPFVLSNAKMKDLQVLDAEWNLATIDVMARCTNKGFQNFTFGACRAAIWALTDEQIKDPAIPTFALKASITGEVQEAANEVAQNQRKVIAYERSDESILNLLYDDGGQVSTAAERQHQREQAAKQEKVRKQPKQVKQPKPAPEVKESAGEFLNDDVPF